MIKDFLFYIPSREKRVLYYEKMQLSSFYMTTLVMIVATSYNVYKVYSDSAYVEVIAGLLLILMILLSIALFWKTRNLLYSQITLIIVIFCMMTIIIWNGGGRFGLASLYYLVSFSILFLVLDYRVIIFLSLYFLIGFLLRLHFGQFKPESMFSQDEFRERFSLVLSIACLLGIVGSISIRVLVKYLSTMAYIDRITRLPNMEKFKETFQSKTEMTGSKKGEGFTLVGIKILHFERINANYGPEFGNEVLKEVSNRLRNHNFELICRWSGSIFMIVLPLGSLPELNSTIKGILETLQKPVFAIGYSNTLQYLAAASRYPDDDTIATEIQKHVLTLLEGRNLIPGEITFFDEEKLIREKYRFSLKEALALADMNSEFSLVYQPKIDLNNNRCIGAEALLRWDRTKIGPVSPEVFIPIAEDSGIIRIITRWILKTVFMDISKYKKCDYVIAVNLSVIDLKDPEFISYLSEQIKEMSISVNQIEFEVTEGILVDSDPQISHTLQSLLDMGFKLAIDDFGTGYSSLNYLHILNVNNLKIDKSFVDLISDEENENLSVVNAIISMGLSMDLKITAEGVETETQAEYLRLKGCHYAQGWLYSKGLPWDAFNSFFNDFK